LHSAYFAVAKERGNASQNGSQAIEGLKEMYVSESEVRAVLTYEALIPAIRQALTDYSAGLVIQPPRTIMRAGNADDYRNGWFATMPVIAGDVMAVKNVTFFPGNDELGMPTHMAVIELLRRATGEPLAVMDGRLITEMRTAAVSAVALAALAPGGARSLGILGSGVQARSHLEAFRHVRSEFSDIRVWSRTTANAQRFADETGARVTSIEDAAAADVVLTVTSSTVPLLKGKWLAGNALVIAVGATGATVRELDDEVVRSSYVVAECKAAAERESGDIILSGARVDAEIGAIVGGKVPAPAGRRTLFKSVGMAIEDLTAARIVWAARSGLPG
jgi:ornithine cyclodeaminase/alanine dehydrogenase-like protein (mu-crystallin family)